MINRKVLTEKLQLHSKWLAGESDTGRLDFHYADLRYANLRYADLRNANLRYANLSGADFSSANLRYADLCNASLRCANLSNANLSYADLCNANLSGADFSSAIGNMREVKSAQFEAYSVCWYQGAKDEIMLSIGCQSHPLSKWHQADPRWISAMAPDATAWWGKYGSVLLQLIEASPPVPWSAEVGE